MTWHSLLTDAIIGAAVLYVTARAVSSNSFVGSLIEDFAKWRWRNRRNRRRFQRLSRAASLTHKSPTVESWASYHRAHQRLYPEQYGKGQYVPQSGDRYHPINRS